MKSEGFGVSWCLLTECSSDWKCVYVSGSKSEYIEEAPLGTQMKASAESHLRGGPVFLSVSRAPQILSRQHTALLRVVELLM